MTTPRYWKADRYPPRCELREEPRRWYVPDPAEANQILSEVLSEQLGIQVSWTYTDGWLVVQP